MFPQQMFPVRANGETFRETTVFPQQCFLVCGALNLNRTVCTRALDATLFLCCFRHLKCTCTFLTVAVIFTDEEVAA